MTGSDLDSFVTWLNAHKTGAATDLGVSLAFNGVGYVNPTDWRGTTPDTLAAATANDKSYFNWISHTYDHANLGTWTVQPPNSDALNDITFTTPNTPTGTLSQQAMSADYLQELDAANNPCC